LAVTGEQRQMSCYELLLPYFVKKNVTKGQRQGLKLAKDTKVSNFSVVHPRSEAVTRPKIC
jgi:hypothetical protein